jgi:hypothetical protein
MRRAVREGRQMAKEWEGGQRGETNENEVGKGAREGRQIQSRIVMNGERLPTPPPPPHPAGYL